MVGLARPSASCCEVSNLDAKAVAMIEVGEQAPARVRRVFCRRDTAAHCSFCLDAIAKLRVARRLSALPLSAKEQRLARRGRVSQLL
jgi:hypothetical protein